jgi:hypothetical protein
VALWVVNVESEIRRGDLVNRDAGFYHRPLPGVFMGIGYVVSIETLFVVLVRHG